MQMIRIFWMLFCSLFGVAVFVQAGEAPVHRIKAKQFAQLPSGVKFPEGITANDLGEIIVSTFDYGGSNNKLIRSS